ncbi:MAG: autotransporter-associated beta strand repeat-containing protein [Verrucomicrobiae bacterium]|nr:autotransporter-associated beta strand repeat-containing protein [Verrucomicrobiae bacterium]
MNITGRVIIVVLVSFAGLALQTARAQTLYWSANASTAGGSGIWDTNPSNPARWGTALGGPFNIVWNNSLNFSNIAQFSGTAGTVTVDPAGVNARRIQVTVSGYTLQGGKITSDQVNNGFIIEKTAVNAVTINNDFDIVSNGTYNVRIRNTGTVTIPLTIGGNYKLGTASGGTRYLDLEGTGVNGSRIDFTGALLDTAGSTVRLRLGNASTNASVYNLSGNSTYGGGTEVVRGTVNISSANAVGSGGVQLATGSTAAGDTVRVFVSGGINLSNPFSTATASGGGAVTAVLGKDTGDTSTSTLSGNINLNSDSTSLEIRVTEAAARINVTGLVTDGAGTRPLTKTGAGVLNLARPLGNTYDGTTFINAGTLLVNNTSGSATGTGALQLSAGATLGGTGLVSGAVTTLGVTSSFSPGNAGTLTIGKLTTGGGNWTQGATLRLELGSALTPGITYDQLAMTGSLTGPSGTGLLNLELTEVGSVDFGVPYTLFTFTSQTGLDYSDITFLSLPAPLDPGFGQGGMLITSSGFQVQFIIPEPSIAGLLLGGWAIVTLARRHKMRTR